jgi:hypothetical protein
VPRAYFRGFGGAVSRVEGLKDFDVQAAAESK